MALTMDSPRPRPSPAAVAVGAQPLEGLEELVDSVRGHERPGVGHHQDRVSTESVGDDSNAAVGAVVVDRVVDEVGDQPFDEPGVSEGGRRRELGSQVEPLVPEHHAWALEDGLGHQGQIERLSTVAAGLPSSEREQRLDEPFLLGAGGEHSLVRSPERLDGRGGVIGCDLDHRPLGGPTACAARAKRWPRTDAGHQMLAPIGQGGGRWCRRGP
jgi:hypothetical protein